MLLWAGGYPSAKIALQYSPALTLLVLRFLLVVLLMLAALLVIRPPLPTSKRGWQQLIIVGLLLQAVYFGCCYIAFEAGVGAGTMALIMSLQPIIVGLIAPYWSNENVSRLRWIGLLLGLIGTLIVIITRADIEPPSFLGVLTALIGLAGIIAASLIEKQMAITHHPITANLIGYSAALVAILPIAMFLEAADNPAQLFAGIEWTAPFIAAIAYLVLGNSVIAVGLLLAMLRNGDVSRVSALFYLVPPLAALIAWLLIGEVLPVIAWPGLLLAAAGVYLATRP